MTTDIPLLRKAITRVDRERSALCAERCAFEQFREAVRLTRPETEDVGRSTVAEELLESYRQEVMDALDYEEVYGESLGESLERETSPAIAEALLSREPFTQRRKRNLLLKTTEAIKRREEFLDELGTERDVLQTSIDELSDIEATLEELPECSPRRYPLEELLTIWEKYDALERRCERLLKLRQRQIHDAERNLRTFGEEHALNEYLYGDLDTPYPVLSAIAETVKRIDSNRTGSTSSGCRYRPVEN